MNEYTAPNGQTMNAEQAQRALARLAGDLRATGDPRLKSAAGSIRFNWRMVAARPELWARMQRDLDTFKASRA